MGEGPARGRDRYANFAQVTVTETGANTETFTDMLTGISLGQRIGILVDQIDYYILPQTLELIIATGDAFTFGWTTSNAAGSLAVDSRRTIHIAWVTIGTIIGTAASAGNLFVQPLSFKFDPPIIIASPRIFGVALGASLAAAGRIDSRLYYRYEPLTSQEYLELAETFLLVG